MNKPTAIFSCFAWCCSLLLLAIALASPAYAADSTSSVNQGGTSQNHNRETTAHNNDQSVRAAVSNTNYLYGTNLHGLQTMNGTHDISVTAFNVCRYIDVNAVPGGMGLFIPFATSGEWLRGTGFANTGFIATSSGRNFVKLDFCRPVTTQSATFTGPGGLSDPSSLVAGQPVNRTYNFDQKRIDTRYTDSEFALSLTERKPEQFNMSRRDCLVMPCSSPGIPYPDGTIRNPSYTWSWVEEITATFIDDIGKTRIQAAADAKAIPVQSGTNNWSYTLARTACIGPNGVSSDGRPVPSNTCPPAVRAPVLGSCPPQNHNTHHWVTVSTGNVRDLHDCGSGFIEDPTRRYTYDLQMDYWCFDSTDYPTGTTREINGVTSGMCRPIIAGQVGPDHTRSFANLPSNDPGLCNVGAVANFTVTNTGWTWTCLGQNTGANAYGYADHAATLTQTCNAASNLLGGSGSVTSACSRYNSNNGTCEGSNPWTSVSGCCYAGQPNNASFNVNGFTVSGCNCSSNDVDRHQTCQASGVGYIGSGPNDVTVRHQYFVNGCSPDTDRPVAQTGCCYPNLPSTQTGDWNGLQLPGCDVPVVGQCGPVNGTTIHYPLDQAGWPGICSSGNGNNGQWNGHGYTWTCDGQNGGATVSCSAEYTPPVNGVCGPVNGTTVNYPLDQAGWPGICSSGNGNHGQWNGHGYTWTCDGRDGGATVNCSAEYVAPEIGTCGSGSDQSGTNQNYDSLNSGAANLCNGNSDIADFNVRPYPDYGDGWHWHCNGHNGGSQAYCTAEHRVNSTCNLSSHGCTNDGTVGSLSGSASSGFTWTCTGRNGGTGDTCAVSAVCTQQINTRTSTPCPSGQTGTITEEQTLDRNNVCGDNVDWHPTSNTCHDTYHYELGDTVQSCQ